MIIGSEKCELIALCPNSSRSKKFHYTSIWRNDSAKMSGDDIVAEMLFRRGTDIGLTQAMMSTGRLLPGNSRAHHTSISPEMLFRYLPYPAPTPLRPDFPHRPAGAEEAQAGYSPSRAGLRCRHEGQGLHKMA
ncbi:hypothetical protein F3P66_23475 [Agrobacterium fabrum]|uniref:Uncharacterized protein n=1 Tax=Agrobacterium fabrum (strain C58 / ATCC 33970) TaxID=176299 RepID=Q8U510_AGRFC|nr:hypothetical protein Atu4779 [Agrobacterium fabrum str. C58]QRM62287.1 hypothetical protein F3P66_23475 [Agrobacterium fabrum]TRB26654.1 hypothetical protein EXN51_22605 [Agrobacterium fabrum]